MSEINVSKDFDAHVAMLISTGAKWSAAAALVPFPYVDLIALGTVQVKLVRDLAQAYGLDSESETLKGVILALLGTLAPAAVSGGLLGSAFKVIPVGGTIIGSMGLAAFGSASTYVIGKVFVAHFEKGGTLKSFNAEAIAADLKKEFFAAKA